MREEKRSSNRKESRKIQVNVYRMITGVLILGLLIVFIVWSLFGSINYPKRFHKEIDLVLGEGNWKVTDVETKKSSLVHKEKVYGRNSRKRSSRASRKGNVTIWTITYTKKDGSLGEMEISNLTHKSDSNGKYFFSEDYSSDKRSFGFGILQAAENQANENMRNQVLAHIFEPDEYEYSSPNIGEKGVGITLSLNRLGQVDDIFFDKMTAEDSHFDLTEFDENELLKTGNYYIDISIDTYKAKEDTVQDINKKAELLKEELKKVYGENATCSIRVGHFEEGQDYHALLEAESSLAYFVYKGSDVSQEEILAASATYQSDGIGVLDMSGYLKGKNNSH